MADSPSAEPRGRLDAAEPLNERRIGWEGQTVSISYPGELAPFVEFATDGLEPAPGPASHRLVCRPIGPDNPGQFSLSVDGVALLRDATTAQAVRALVDELVRCLITDIASGVVVHAGCVSRAGHAILIAGASGAGKSSMTAWLSGHGFDYHSDEAALLAPDHATVTALPRPVVFKDAQEPWIEAEGLRASAEALEIGAGLLAWPGSRRPAGERLQCRLCLFPKYLPESPLRIRALSAADAALALTGLNANARNLDDHGFAIITGFARNAVAVEIAYSDFSDLEGVAEMLGLLAASELPADAMRRFLRVIGSQQEPPVTDAVAQPTQRLANNTTLAPTALPAGTEPLPEVTIGMATYDDYDGAYFTIQSLRLFHPEVLDRVEFVVVDNNPRGPCARALKALENEVRGYRYVPHDARRTNAAKAVVFEVARAETVLCLDSHVLVAPGAIRRLIDYAKTRGGGRDFWQGPLIYDNLSHVSTHLSPQWRGGMFGCWATDERGLDADAEPFEIDMQGMGLFACRRNAWPGFNAAFRGFAVEEGYIHEKIRRAGGRVLCLPFLRWLHRFNRPMGVPYLNIWEDRVRNYVIAYRELGLDTNGIAEHFTELLGPGIMATVRAAHAEADRLDGQGGSGP